MKPWKVRSLALWCMACVMPFAIVLVGFRIFRAAWHDFVSSWVEDKRDVGMVYREVWKIFVTGKTQ